MADLWSAMKSPRKRARGTVGGPASPIGSEGLLLVVLSLADLLLTYRLLAMGTVFYEGNPVARWVFDRWNVAGLIAYKFGLVALVVVLGHVIELRRPGWGRAVVLFGCLAAAVVFVQGLRLWLRHA
jgi:hypothetical protein